MDIFDQLSEQNNSDQWVDILPIKKGVASVEEGVGKNDTVTGDIFDQLANQETKRIDDQLGFLGTTRDIAEQVSTKGISGIGGAYGNILEAVGLNFEKQSNSQEEKNKREFDILSKMERGEVPSYGEFLDLSSDDPIPSYNGLPTSKGIQKQIEQATGIGEGKTPIGRIAGKGAESFGEGISLPGGGVKSLIGLGLGGAGGQAVRETGGPEALATGIDIAGAIGPSVITKKLAPLTKTGKDIVNAGKKIGLAEKEIAPLLSGEKKVATLAPLSRKGTRTKKVFGEIKEKLSDSYNTVKSSKEAKIKLPVSDRVNLLKDFTGVRNDLAKTLAPSPDKEAVMKYIDTAMETLSKQEITPEHLVNFWQDVNKTVNWNSIGGGKKSLARLKEPVSSILKKRVPELAEDFELTNDLYSKYANISKRLKPDLVDSFVNKGEVFGFGPAALALANGNPMVLYGLGSGIALRVLAREMLINPYFQTLAGKLVKNFNSGSIKAIETSVNQAKEFLDRKYPDEDWGFLNKVSE